MSMRTRLAATGIAAILCCVPAAAQQSDFVYQGRLLDDGAPVNQRVDAVFSLWSAATGGVRVGQPIALNGLTVTDGLLAANLDFGPEMYNGERWLEISINRITLSPRQPIAPAPKAIRLEGVTNGPNGEFGVNTNSPQARWHVVQDDGNAIRAESLLEPAIVGTSAAEWRAGVMGTSTSPNGIGVSGSVEGTQGEGIAVSGQTLLDEGVGVKGWATNPNGAGTGVIGRSAGRGTFSTGVYGVADSLTGTVYGGRFTSASSSNGSSGVVAQAFGESGLTFGVQARMESPDGRAVAAYVDANSGGTALYASNTNPDGYAGHFRGRVHAEEHTTIGRENIRVSQQEWFGVHTPAGSGQYGGMYVSGQNSGAYPFYGYSTNGAVANAFHYFNGQSGVWHLWATATRMSIDSSNGYVGFGDSSPDYPLDMASGARCTAGGVWTNASSRAWKQDFEPADTRDVLARVAALPISEWSYKSEPGVRHVGPVAEDFAEAFGLGGDAQTIGTVDADGVALAAIKGLNEIVEEKDAEISELRARLVRLEALVEAMAGDE